MTVIQCRDTMLMLKAKAVRTAYSNSGSDPGR
jgi:hypothetical protein